MTAWSKTHRLGRDADDWIAVSLSGFMCASAGWLINTHAFCPSEQPLNTFLNFLPVLSGGIETIGKMSYYYIIFFTVFVSFLCCYPPHWSPSVSVDILATGLLSCHPQPIIIWQLLGTGTHTKTHTAGYGIIPRCLILKAPLGSWQFSFISLLKVTLHVKKGSVCQCAKAKWCLCLNAANRTAVTHTLCWQVSWKSVLFVLKNNPKGSKDKYKVAGSQAVLQISFY